MRLKYDLEMMEVVDDRIAIPVSQSQDSFHGILRINEVTSDILDLLKEDTTEEAVIESLLQVYDASREEVAESVHRVVAQLQEAGLLTE